MSIPKALYRRLPISVRSLAATAQGLRLSWWRYGRVAENAALEAHDMNPVLYGLPLREARFVQESVNRMRVRVVPTAGFGAESEQALAARIRERMGDIGVHVEEVAEIGRTATGKVRHVICQVPAAEREAVLAGRERGARRSA